MNAVAWLCFGGTEIANEARTLTYIRRGLAGRGWNVPARHPLLTSENCHDEVTDDAYVDEYDDVYDGTGVTVCDPVDRLDPRNLLCFCEDAVDAGEQFVDPATDEAPWYVAGRTESEEFLGVLPVSIVRRPSLSRPVTATTRGSLFGPLSLGSQFVEVTARLVASSDAGMAWGERWLLDALAAPSCDDLAELQMILACGTGVRSLVNAGLVDTPVFSDEGDMPSCKLRTVSLQFASEAPWHFGEGEIVFSGALSSSLSGEASTEEWAGDGALVLEVLAGPDASVRLTIKPGECGSGRPACFDVTASIPGGHRLVIDSRTRTLEVIHTATGESAGGLEFLTYTGTFTWPEVGPCSTVCVSATPVIGGGDVTAIATFYPREL